MTKNAKSGQKCKKLPQMTKNANNAKKSNWWSASVKTTWFFRVFWNFGRKWLEMTKKPKNYQKHQKLPQNTKNSQKGQQKNNKKLPKNDQKWIKMPKLPKNCQKLTKNHQ